MIPQQRPSQKHAQEKEEEMTFTRIRIKFYTKHASGKNSRMCICVFQRGYVLWWVHLLARCGLMGVTREVEAYGAPTSMGTYLIQKIRGRNGETFSGNKIPTAIVNIRWLVTWISPLKRIRYRSLSLCGEYPVTRFRRFVLIFTPPFDGNTQRLPAEGGKLVPAKACGALWIPPKQYYPYCLSGFSTIWRDSKYRQRGNLDHARPYDTTDQSGFDCEKR